jgi:hypothetical protein
MGLAPRRSRRPSTPAWQSSSEAKWFEQREDQNAKLKHLLADAMLDNAALKDP